MPLHNILFATYVCKFDLCLKAGGQISAIEISGVSAN